MQELQSELSFQRRDKQKEWPFRYVFRTQRMYGVDNGVGITYGGFYSRIRNKLASLGYEIEVEDEQVAIPKADFSQVRGELRTGQDVVMAAISVSRRGIIDCPTAFGKSFVIMQLVLIYAHLKILIVTPAKAVVESLTKRLTEGTDSDVIQVRAGYKFRSTANVVMCSAKSLHHIPPDWPDILMFDECHGVAAPQIQEKMVKFSSCRMFGFSASPDGRLDGADMVVEAFFGKVLARMPYKEAVNTGSVVPIEVYIKRINCPDVQYSTDIQKERRGYWRNDHRNLQIALISRQIPDGMQTLIMVRTTEHALALQSLLPDYAVAHGGKSREDWAGFIHDGVIKNWATEAELAAYGDVKHPDRLLLADFEAGKKDLASFNEFGNPDTTKLREEFEAGTLKKAIATTMWKEGIDPIHLRVLIRADGTSGNIPATQIPGRLARTAEGKRAGILIDFQDAYGDTFLRRSQGRIRQYRKKEWSINEDWDGRFTTSMGSV